MASQPARSTIIQSSTLRSACVTHHEGIADAQRWQVTRVNPETWGPKLSHAGVLQSYCIDYVYHVVKGVICAGSL